jgi:hypothetical protein
MSEKKLSIDRSIMVTYGDFWVKIAKSGIEMGYGGGYLASFPSIEVFENLMKEVKDAWDYISKLEQRTITIRESPKPEESRVPTGE